MARSSNNVALIGNRTAVRVPILPVMTDAYLIPGITFPIERTGWDGDEYWAGLVNAFTAWGWPGKLLRAGVLLAAAVVLAGGLVYLVRHGGEPRPDLRHYRPDYVPAELRSPSGIVTEALTGRGRGLIQLGLLLLIATPVMRVAASRNKSSPT